MNGMIDKMKSTPYKRRSDHNAADISESEELILEKKLQVKTQALLILSQDLDQCRMQRDRFRLLAEQLQQDLDRRKESIETNGYSKNIITSSSESSSSDFTHLDEDTKLFDLLVECKEKNKCLQLQVDTLRHKLKEAQDDVKVLRNIRKDSNNDDKLRTLDVHQREELIEQLEKLNIKYKQLKIDIQSIIDEKQELELERDAFKCKAHRLNYELSKALNASKPVDVDALINENRFLQERLQQLLEEKELARQSVQKYKSMLDSKRQKGSIKLGANIAVGSVMTFKQVEELLKQGPNIPPQKSAAALTELHSLCTALMEALNDKSLALVHQKKANKILASRLCELEGSIQSPTMKLLEGYTSADVDTSRCDSTSIASDLSEERSEDKMPNTLNEDLYLEQNIKVNSEDGVESMQSCNSEKSFELFKKSEPSIIHKNNFEDNNDSNKSIGQFSGDENFAKYNYEESLNNSLPEHLKTLVQIAIQDLKVKNVQ